MEASAAMLRMGRRTLLLLAAAVGATALGASALLVAPQLVWQNDGFVLSYPLYAGWLAFSAASVMIASAFLSRRPSTRALTTALAAALLAIGATRASYRTESTAANLTTRQLGRACSVRWPEVDRVDVGGTRILLASSGVVCSVDTTALDGSSRSALARHIARRVVGGTPAPTAVK